ncbi:uncharacterized protein LOC143209145 isoform X2 [Lasioglossum baleicum]|uniref:uncharacterized protein LOC143209145 isoform X2 n=1 Tax=Lasioglossum baleicum TaxID=434251 RepID=UPI003FCCE399
MSYRCPSRIMRFLTVLLLLGCIGLNVPVHGSVNYNFDEKLRQSKIEIAKLHFQETAPVPKKLYNVKWDRLWEESLGNQRLFVANALDKILYVEGNRVATFSVDSPPSKQTLMAELPASWRGNGAMRFVRSIVWKSVLYLLICYETGSCSLYARAEGLQFKHWQTIQHKSHPMDASFFVRQNRLYLVVAENSGQYTVPSLIYHWRGTYMDKVAEAMTTAAVSVTTFKHKQSTIIVFAQNDQHNPNIGTMVYEFKEDNADRIQFLSTINPVSVHHYTHDGYSFILLLNGRGPSNLFWWDGQELLNWQQLDEIDAPSLVRVVTVNDDTFFIAADTNRLRLYKFENSSDCTLLSLRKLSDVETVIEMEARTEKTRVIIVLVTTDQYGNPSVRSWELDIKEILSGDSIVEPEDLSKRLLELAKMLERRQPLIQKLEASWPSLYPANENLKISDPLIIPNLILESGTVDNINVHTSGDILTPHQLKEGLRKLTLQVNSALTKSRNLLAAAKNSLTGNIVIEDGDSMEILEIDKLEVDYLNDVDVRSKSVESSTSSLAPLHGSNISVQNVEIESLCGIPSQYWALRNGSSGVDINLEPSEIEFSNDTVHLRSNISLTNLNARMLNNIDVEQFLDELFVVGKNQKIRGNLKYNNVLQVCNLTAERLNNQSVQSYMTTGTNQTFDHFEAKSLQLEHLIAETINGVSVSEAARISRPNVIKGQVKIGKIHVTEELMMDGKYKLPENRQQIYYNITMQGDLRIKALDMDKHTQLLLDNEEVQLDDVDSFWTKSTDQIITNDVIFENKVTIDRLLADRLNGFAEDEFLYTTATAIPESFGHIRFENVEFDDPFSVNDILFNDEPEMLTIRNEVRVEQLRGNNLLVERFNGLGVFDILNNLQPVNFSKRMNFSTIRARQVNVDHLHFQSINGQNSAEFFANKENDPNNRVTSFLKTPVFRAKNLTVERINDIDMKKLESLRNTTDSKDLVVEGDLTVTGNLRIDLIDDQSVELYLRNLAKEDIVWDLEETIDELIVQNATLETMNGHNVHNFFEGVLSRSKEQIVPGQFSFNQMSAGNVVTRFINDRDSMKLRWIDEPLFLTGNITFDELHVHDVTTRTLNDQDVRELYENLSIVSATRIGMLSVDGNVTWGTASPSSSSLTFLFENAVTKTTAQTIHGKVVFDEAVSISAAKLELKEIDEIRDIVTDAVKDHENTIQISGQKIFANNLTINSLSVAGDVKIPIVNNVDVVEFNNSVARKYQNETITGTLTFLEEAAINELYVNDSIHDVPLDGLVLATDTLPPNVHFKHLFVTNDVYLKNLDGVEFDEFLENRITIHGDHDIATNVTFNGIVGVTGNTTVARINGIDPSDFVLDGLAETQFISGSKTFAENVRVDGNIRAQLINGLNLYLEYSDGILNDENAEIVGDLVFETEVKVPEDVTVSGLVNGISLNTILEELKEETQHTLEALKYNETVIEGGIERSSRISERLRNILSYVEFEKNLKIEVPNIKAVGVVYYENITKLNMFGEEAGPLCGLPSNCSCPTEYVAELRKDGCRVWRTNSSTIVRNFHELHSTFGVNIVTNAVSSSLECTSTSSEDEFTTISWMKLGIMDTGDVVDDVMEYPTKIKGFVKDAAVFMDHNNAVHVVLAIYYDTLNQSHQTDSVVYKINLDTNLLSLHQNLPTDGAWDIEVFKANHHDVYLLLACSGISETSFLSRLNGTTSQFETLRTFNGRSRNAKSIIQEKDLFVLLDDYDTNAVNVFRYESKFDNFYIYQSLFHDSRIDAVSCFYADEFGVSDAFIIVATENDHFYIYEYMYAQKFQRRVHHRINDLQTMVPFYYAGNRYIFTGTSINSTVLRIVEQGPR